MAISFERYCFQLIKGKEYRDFVVCAIAAIFVSSIISNIFYIAMIEELNNNNDATFYIVMNILTQVLASYIQLKMSSHKNTLSKNISTNVLNDIFSKVLRIDHTRLLEEKITKIFWTIDRVIGDIQYFIFETVDVAIYISQNVISCFIILTVSPIGFIIFVSLNVLFYIYYRSSKSKNLAQLRKDNNEKVRTLYNDVECTVKNLFDSIIHNEVKSSIDIISEKKQSIEQLWFSNEEESEFLNFYQNIISRIGILLCYMVASGNGVIMLTLIVNMQQMVFMWNRLMSFHSHTTGKKQNFLKAQEYIELADKFTRRTFLQLNFTKNFSISNLSCTLKGKDRKDFVLHMQPQDKFNFSIGDIVWVKGDSGHGKSTFYSVLSGISDYNTTSIKLLTDDVTNAQNGFYQMMDMRVVIMQDYDKYLDFDMTWFDIIVGQHVYTDIKTVETEINNILRMVNLLSVIQEQFDGDLHKKVGEHKLSGGQKTKLGLAKVIFRIKTKKPKFIIFDEPDKGLPLNECNEILNRIIETFKNGSIIFITTHLQDLNIKTTKTINIVNGILSLDSSNTVWQMKWPLTSLQ